MAFQFPASPVLGQTFTPVAGTSYTWNGTGWSPLGPVTASGSQPYELGAGYAGAPTASAVLLRAPMCRTVTFAAGLSPSQGVAGTAATAQTDFNILKNGVSFGTMRFAAAGTVASFISASGSTPVAGDVITVVAPASPDATLANIGFILAGTR